MLQLDGPQGVGNRLVPGGGVMAEGWLLDCDQRWAYRFHRDEKSWLRDPKVFVDMGRPMPDGSPALLRTRQHLRREDAEKFWKNLVHMGWQRTEPLWGASADV